MMENKQLFPTTTSSKSVAAAAATAAATKRISKSPSLVFNASRMARMVGGLTSSVMNTKSRENRRSQHMLQSKSGHELGSKSSRARGGVVADGVNREEGGGGIQALPRASGKPASVEGEDPAHPQATKCIRGQQLPLFKSSLCFSGCLAKWQDVPPGRDHQDGGAWQHGLQNCFSTDVHFAFVARDGIVFYSKKTPERWKSKDTRRFPRVRNHLRDLYKVQFL